MKKDKDVLEDLASVTLKSPISEEEKEVLITQEPSKIIVHDTVDYEVDEVLNKEQKKKLAADAKQVNKVLGIKKKGKYAKEANLPDHIRKAFITINDKSPNDPISITFNGDWTGKDINLAGKHLILEYQIFVRNRAISNR